ncbi:hypothetical protein INT43_008362 [Umbelopsis isabellina]|uniref:NmrA-like domain-containing protein n=1 Tax=Mortierella isabellina TaxID=91625 RepID=A0A8H7U6Q9_MORIS|nr:hypothetical protein INT43_008362 [Umbelopsis isabellina]
MSKNTILVTTATGNVGGHVATLLLEHGFNVNALVRNPDSEAAQKLKAQGVTLFKGDFDDVPSIEAAAEGVYGVFINAVPSNNDEFKHNSNIITAAKSAGAKIVVYMSVVMADRKDQFPGYGPENPAYTYWEAKAGTEKNVQEAGFDHWTIIRPAMFLSNFHSYIANFVWPQLQKEHKLVYPSLNTEGTFPLVDLLDIGKFCAAPFWDTKAFDKQMIDLRTEDMTLTQLAEIMTKTTGIPIKAEYITREEATTRGIPERATSWADFRASIGYQVDVEHLKKFPIKLSSVEAYLERNKDRVIQYLSQ